MIECDQSYVLGPLSNEFPGCLYTLDAIEHIGATSSEDPGRFVLLDNDCLLRRPLPDQRAGGPIGCYIGVYPQAYPAAKDTNGQSRASMTLAASCYSKRLIENPLPHIGGEFLDLPLSNAKDLACQIRSFWNWLTKEGQYKMGNIFTEEHILTAVFGLDHFSLDLLDAPIKRIWNTPNYTNLDGSEMAFPIWHLPSEKKLGIRKLYYAWKRFNSFGALDDQEFDKLIVDCLPNIVIGRHRKRPEAIRRLLGAARFAILGRL